MNSVTSGSSVLHSLLDFAQIHVHWVSNVSSHLILCCPLLLLSSIFPSIRVFSSELALHIRWPKYWSFSISPSNEYSGLISFRIDWFDIAVQGTLKSLLQHHNSKASILHHSTFLMVQLSQINDCPCKYFLSVCGLASHSLDIVFCRAEVLNFDEVWLFLSWITTWSWT